MIRYKAIWYIFCAYSASILLIAYFSLIFIPNTITFVSSISQISAAFITVIIFSLYLKAWKILKIFIDINNLLNEDPDWDSMGKNFSRALRLKPNNHKKPSNLPFYLIMVSSLLIIISLTINFLQASNIVFYLIPSFFIIFLATIYPISNVSENPSKNLNTWVYESSKSLFDEFNRLKQFKVEGTGTYFKNIDKKLSSLSIKLKNFKITGFKISHSNNIFTMLTSLKKNFKTIHKIIQEIYEIRGMLINLMSVILELRKNQVLKFSQLDQLKKKQVEAERLKIIEQKEAKFHNLETLIEETFHNKSKEITEDVRDQFDSLKNNWNEKISEFEQKINQVYYANYQRFGSLNEELKDSYQKLQSKATSLFFEKFFEGLIRDFDEKRSIESYFEEFMFVADIFFSETIDKLDRAELIPIMEKLSLIHEKMK